MYVLAQTSATSSRSAASAPDPDPAPQGPVTWEAADRAVSEAEALQTLVSDLGTAVVEAGVRDMAPLEDLMARTVEVASAANDMLEAVDLGADESAHSARDRFHVQRSREQDVGRGGAPAAPRGGRRRRPAGRDRVRRSAERVPGAARRPRTGSARSRGRATGGVPRRGTKMVPKAGLEPARAVKPTSS